MPHQPVEPLVVCDQFLFHASEGSKGGSELLTPMKLLKLVFISHGWMLGLYGWPLISETPEVWQYGPVVPSVYRRYKHFRGNYITDPGRDRSDDLDSHQKQLIQEVWKGYRGYSGVQLSVLTHKKNTPWDQARKDNRIKIDDTITRKYYRELAIGRGIVTA